MGPASRVAEFKAIETRAPTRVRSTVLGYSRTAGRRRTSPTRRRGASPALELPGSDYSRTRLPGSTRSRPRPSASSQGRASARSTGRPLRRRFAHDLLGRLPLRFDLTATGRDQDQRPASRRPRRRQRHKFDLAESESLLVGRDFGIVTDIQTGPDGNLSSSRSRTARSTKSTRGRSGRGRREGRGSQPAPLAGFGYSYWSARRTFRRAARLAGMIAARIPTITAMIEKRSAGPTGSRSARRTPGAPVSRARRGGRRAGARARRR